MRINTNVSSITAQEAAINTNNNIKSSLEKLSSGLRINKASDDASGLAIADKLRTQATSINQGVSNGNSAVTLLQIADKSMAEQSNILDTVKSKLIQANTDTTSADGRESIRKDIVKLLEQLDNIAEQTNYNGNVLLQNSAGDTSEAKSASQALSFQIGESKNDIIKNTTVQSNTDGLGSKTSYGTGTTLSAGNDMLVTSSSGITIEADNKGTENVTIKGDVDSIDLAIGGTISAVDAETTALLQAASGITDNGDGTFKVDSAFTLSTASIDNVEMTISTPETESFGGQNFTTGQIVDVRNSTLTSGSDLDTKLKDANLFTEVTTGVYVAIDAGSIDSLETGETFDLMSTTNVQGGSGTTEFNAGDVIKANNAVTGGLLEKTLSDTNSFKDNGDGSYTVLEDFDAGQLRLMQGESVSITQGQSVDLGVSSGTSGQIDGMNVSDLKYNPGGDTAAATSAYQSTGDFSNIQLDNATASGSQLYGAGEDTISFKVTASGSSTFNYEQGDIISGVSETSGTAMSSGIYSSDNFVRIASGQYQALNNGSLSVDGTDSFSVQRLVGGTSDPEVVSFDKTVTEGKISLNDQSISMTAGSTGVTITNNSADSVNLSSATEMSNGKQSLSALATLGAGELTKEKADSFQAVVDDAITDLNGYRGDIGSTQNQVESAVRNLMTQATNVKAAESIIRDVDYAQESANFNKQNIISQAGSYAISQANSTQQNVLRLLQ